MPQNRQRCCLFFASYSQGCEAGQCSGSSSLPFTEVADCLAVKANRSEGHLLSPGDNPPTPPAPPMTPAVIRCEVMESQPEYVTSLIRSHPITRHSRVWVHPALPQSAVPRTPWRRSSYSAHGRLVREGQEGRPRRQDDPLVPRSRRWATRRHALVSHCALSLLREAVVGWRCEGGGRRRHLWTVVATVG
ncbi:hypothetical protein O3P69_020433 [Scylla paramamosain]|uniref:Uncharacterized protein n=1 Tax=Scylla paramamosain TaxID=85552 RepID=A0AAW0TMY8_SCYPA